MTEKTKTIYHREFGEITLRKRTGVRRLSISVRPFSGVRVTLSPYMSYKQAESFLHEKGAWIRKQMAKIQKFEQGRTNFSSDTVFTTREHILRLYQSPGSAFKYSISNGEIRVYYPSEYETGNTQVQDWIRNALIETWRLEAKQYLPKRLRHLAEMHGFSYNRVFIRNNRSRWGSCSAKNNINLNLHLMRLPDELTDYVLLHELVHTRHKNHGPDFWGTLGNYVPDVRTQDKRLKDFRIDVL